jgi:transcriptional regulator with XRE-family HTH domain
VRACGVADHVAAGRVEQGEMEVDAVADVGRRAHRHEARARTAQAAHLAHHLAEDQRPVGRGDPLRGGARDLELVATVFADDRLRPEAGLLERADDLARELARAADALVGERPGDLGRGQAAQLELVLERRHDDQSVTIAQVGEHALRGAARAPRPSLAVRRDVCLPTHLAGKTDGVDESLGRRIADHRAKLGWTQQDLAERVGISRVAVSHMESGMTDPSERTVALLAGVFKVTPYELVAGTSYPAAKIDRLPLVVPWYTEAELQLELLEHERALTGGAIDAAAWRSRLAALLADSHDERERAAIRSAIETL